MSDLENYPELAGMLKEAQQKMLERHSIWYQRAFGVKSSMEFRKGLVLGGAHSPFFLAREPVWGPVQKRVPWVFWASMARILVAETITTTMRDWLPFVETMTKAGEALLIVTPEVQNQDLLAFFVVNAHAQSLLSCPIHPGDMHTSDLRSLAQHLAAKKRAPYLGKGEAPQPIWKDDLPRASEVWVRSDATLLWPEAGAKWDSLLSEVAIIHVGAETLDEQQERLTALAQAIQKMATGFFLSL